MDNLKKISCFCFQTIILKYINNSKIWDFVEDKRELLIGEEVQNHMKWNRMIQWYHFLAKDNHRGQI